MGYRDDIDIASFWRRIDRLLVENGMTMNELNEKCRLHGTYLYVIRSRQAIPSIPVLNRIADIFSVSLDWLVNGDDSRYQGETQFESMLLERLRTDSEFKTAIEMVCSSQALVRLIADRR